MRCLCFNFSHPLQGVMRLTHKTDPAQKRVLKVSANEDALNIEVSLDGLAPGNWKAAMEWEYDGRDFHFEQDFEIDNP